MTERYNHSSAAYDFDLFLPKERREHVEEPGDNVVELPKRAAAREAQHRSLSAALLLRRAGTALFVAAILFLIGASLYTRSEISVVESGITADQGKLSALQGDETRMNAQLMSRISYVNLEQAAQALGMQKADQSQITYVPLGNQDSVQLYDAGGNPIPGNTAAAAK